jgi:hypothetical protein
LFDEGDPGAQAGRPCAVAEVILSLGFGVYPIFGVTVVDHLTIRGILWEHHAANSY